MVRKAARDAGAVLIEVPVGDRDSYKDKPQNPWRVFSKTKVTHVPTLLKWGIGGERARLIDSDCSDPAKVAALFAADVSLRV